MLESREPIEDGGSAVAASVLHFGSQARAVGLIIEPNGAYLLTAASIFNVAGLELDGGSGAIVPIYAGNIFEFAQSWIHLELTVTGSPLPELPPLAAGIGIEWARQPVVTAGGALFPAGSLVIRQDNVTFDFLAP